jgi:hypothetical protein
MAEFHSAIAIGASSRAKGVAVMGIPVFARLWFDAHKHRGHVHFGTVDFDLDEPPSVLGGPVEIDYGEIHPDQVGWAQVRHACSERMIEMRADEIQAVHDWLRRAAILVSATSPQSWVL